MKSFKRMEETCLNVGSTALFKYLACYIQAPTGLPESGYLYITLCHYLLIRCWSAPFKSLATRCWYEFWVCEGRHGEGQKKFSARLQAP